MGLAGDVLVFMAALQVCIEILQVQPLRVVPATDISVSSHRLLQHPHFMKIHNTAPQVDHFVFSVGHAVIGLRC